MEPKEAFKVQLDGVEMQEHRGRFWMSRGQAVLSN